MKMKVLIAALCSLLALVFISSLVIAEIQIQMFLKPGSFWWNKINWDSAPREPKDEFEKQLMENESRIRKEADLWSRENKSEDWYLESKDDLTLHAEVYAAKTQTHFWAVCVHGYRGTIANTKCYGVNYYGMGYNVLLPENRTSGQSEGTYIGMGWLEKNDLEVWVEKILSVDDQAQIVLHGESMGAATVLMASGDSLPSNVKCIVADCGYTSVWDEFSHVMKNAMHLPAFPLLYFSSAISRFQLGYSFKKASAKKQLEKSSTPTLFLHGEDDDFVPTFMSGLNFSSLSAPKEVKFFPHSAHCESKFYDPDLYWKTVSTFVEKYVD